LSYRGHKEGCYGNVRRLQRVHSHRSSRAKKIDESLRTPLAKSDDEWLAQPNRFDVPDVDTPKKEHEHEETARTFEPKPLTHSQFKQKLAMHRVYGNTH
jgi:hypothetical protein